MTTVIHVAHADVFEQDKIRKDMGCNVLSAAYRKKIKEFVTIGIEGGYVYDQSFSLRDVIIDHLETYVIFNTTIDYPDRINLEDHIKYCLQYFHQKIHHITLRTWISDDLYLHDVPSGARVLITGEELDDAKRIDIEPHLDYDSDIFAP